MIDEHIADIKQGEEDSLEFKFKVKANNFKDSPIIDTDITDEFTTHVIENWDEFNENKMDNNTRKKILELTDKALDTASPEIHEYLDVIMEAMLKKVSPKDIARVLKLFQEVRQDEKEKQQTDGDTK